MRVLMVSWEYPPVVVGGLGRHVHALTTELAAAGHDVVVLTRRPTGTERRHPPDARRARRGRAGRGTLRTWSSRATWWPGRWPWATAWSAPR